MPLLSAVRYRMARVYLRDPAKRSNYQGAIMGEPAKTGTIEANGAVFYYELQGSGPTLLFIPGGHGVHCELPEEVVPSPQAVPGSRLIGAEKPEIPT
jgi:hypothetical protein